MPRKKKTVRSSKLTTTHPAINPRTIFFLFLLVGTTFFIWVYLSRNARETSAAQDKLRPVITRPAGNVR
ncbi:MAG: hypothetical protein N2691_04305 [Patescibacteria group bacterium]|nr:hypothetical protein [Patescibacteria group bacterium]